MASAEQQAQDLIAGLLRDARSEGDAEGYKRGRQETLNEVSRFLATLGAAQLLTVPTSLIQPPQQPQSPTQGDLALEEASRRRPRGQNRELVKTVLGLVGKPMGATEIQRHLKSDGLAYSSIRNALAQLVEAGQVVELTGGVFELKSEAAPSDTEEAA